MSTPKRSEAFAGVWAKMDRAERHLRKLDKKIGVYLDSDPYKVIGEQNPGSDLVAYVLRVTEQPPLRLATIVGDCLHNLRSALDHLAWQLVLASGNTPSVRPGDRTYFPIYTSDTTRKGQPRIVDIRPGVQGRMLGIVEGMQPYHRRNDPDAHPLAILNELTNRDKHRTLNLTAAKVLDAEFYLINTDTGERFGGKVPSTGQTFTGLGQPFANVGVVRDDDVLGLYQLPPNVSTVPSHWQIEGSGISFVALHEPGPWENEAVLAVLERLLKYVGETVIPAFEPFFH